MRLQQQFFVIAALLVGVVHSPSTLATGSAADEIKSRLQARWFEVEIIVFERLPVLDVNNPERLALDDFRQWPNTMIVLDPAEDSARIALPEPATEPSSVALSEDPAPLDLGDEEQPLPEQDAALTVEVATTNVEQVYQQIAQLQAPLALSRPSRYCLGFPMLPERDDPHPGLLPRHSVPVPSFDVLQTRQAQRIAQGQESSAADVEDVDPVDTRGASETGHSEDSVGAHDAADQRAVVEGQDSSRRDLLEVPSAGESTSELDRVASADGSSDSVPDPHLELLAAINEFEAGLYASSYRLLPTTTLDNQVKAITRQQQLRPILHQRWRAPLPARDAPLPLYISSEVDDEHPETEAGFPRVAGFISVTVARYLHFAPTLWYHADTLGGAPLVLPMVESAPPTPNVKYMQLAESRRMRSGDLHYLDHPKFGIVVRIDPVAIPDELLQAWESLEVTDDQLVQ